ncbi:transcriptional regulator, TetR family [Kribbella flavida DSM 17836]|uniref:Transcriptional regulator, TetR family n=1 Tax=Kribbella flavida (strain DSM 17836 / JCM 10339 / NBRC 14399) TaxID=479435 RepID=D2PYE8_KRIFD|nr:TetR/AcrR family transcriptional regulator [Kribbella flavida]ADB35516.1 transcriptional regulator, TetR family [Kribbella flavida DSM 17836]
MPAKTDHDARRRDVSAAVWKVVAADGFGGLTLRAVAAAMGGSTGLVTHYFPSKQALVLHALEVAEQRTQALVPDTTDLRTALIAVLPLTAETTELNRVWVSSWDVALADPQLAALEQARYRRWRTRLKPLVIQAQNDGDLITGDAMDLAAGLAAFTHGLVVQALVDPRTFGRKRLELLLDAHLTALRPRR